VVYGLGEVRQLGQVAAQGPAVGEPGAEYPLPLTPDGPGETLEVTPLEEVPRVQTHERSHFQ